MHLVTYENAAAFLDDHRAWLAASEVANGLMLGLAFRLVGDPLAYGDAPYFAGVFDAERVLLGALMTPPHNLLLAAPAPDVSPAAHDLVADDLVRRGFHLPGVNASALLSEGFAGSWTRRTGALSRPGMHHRIYELRQVVQPGAVPGDLRQAAEADLELVREWTFAFALEALSTMTPADAAATRRAADRRVAAGDVYLWVDRQEVSMAGRTRALVHGQNIGLVYTPPEFRRRGYASACVAALSQRLLDAGAQFCTLVTDLANPTSNAIYQRIGYRPVCDSREILFA